MKSSCTSKQLLSFIFSVFLIFSVNSQEQKIADNLTTDEEAALSEALTLPPSQEKQIYVDYYEADGVTNEIPYFDNRFRIDAEIEEVTMLFYRKAGTKPIILVQPDGSKIKVNQLDKEKVEWFDDRTFDMIKIKTPMPGPWQAIGNIMPNSKIMVMSEVRIEVDPLPDILLSGETIKITARLFNGKDPIETPAFREVVTLDVDFYSTNDSNYDNFGAEPIKLTSFRDDGYDLDERPADGVFTGEFNLNFAAGEWQPLYYITLPMAKRELRLPTVILRHNPITIDVKPTLEKKEFHQLILDIDPTYVDPDSLVFQGKILFPDKQVESFSVVEGKGTQRVYNIHYTEPGIHRVNVNAFGKTTHGREFQLEVPQMAFNVERKPIEEPTAIALEIDLVAKAEERRIKLEQELEIARQEAAAKKAAEEHETIMIIVIGNVVVIVLAVIGFFGMRLYRKRKQKKVENES